MLDEEIKNEFSGFGNKMRTIAICTILLFIPFVNIVALILILIKAISSLGNIKRINNKVNNKNLKSYRSYFLISYVIFLVGTIIFILLIINLINTANEIMQSAGDDLEWARDRINNLLYDFQSSTMKLNLIQTLFMSVLQFIAWSHLKVFFKKNSNIFPEFIAYDAKKGSNNLKIAAIINFVASIGGIFVFTFGLMSQILGYILGIVGLVLLIIGYFNLSALRQLNEHGTQQLIPTPVAMAEDTKNFCPNCGSSITSNQKFCTTCGSEL